MDEKDMIMNMSEEILRLKQELVKYKWTEENPMVKTIKEFKMEFYFREVNLGSEDNRILRPVAHVKINGETIPVFRLAKLYALAKEEE
jgi:hypothetical protein